LATTPKMGKLRFGVNKTIYTDEYRALSIWLRQQRRLRGFTMRQLAKSLGVHHSWIGRVEQGERRLDMVEFVSLCREIGCDAREGLDLVMARDARSRLRLAAETRATYETHDRAEPRS